MTQHKLARTNTVNDYLLNAGNIASKHRRLFAKLNLISTLSGACSSRKGQPFLMQTTPPCAYIMYLSHQHATCKLAVPDVWWATEQCLEICTAGCSA